MKMAWRFVRSAARAGSWLRATFLALSLSLSATATADCSGTPCLNPALSQAEALFAQIETRYPQWFSMAGTTRSELLDGATAFYRLYGSPPFGLATYQGGLWYSLGTAWNRYSSLDEGNRQFCDNACWPATPAPASLFTGNVLLGAPTARSITLSLLSPAQTGTAWVAYGTLAGALDRQSPAIPLTAASPAEVRIDALAGNTRYYYRVHFLPGDGAALAATPVYSFQTARPAGSTFTFTIQADSHLDENSDPDLYRRTLANVLADNPDFHIDLGDTFMCEKHAEPLSATSPPATDVAGVEARYRAERANFGAMAHSVPLFLVNGNHEGEAGWLNTGGSQNLAVWTSLARERFFVNPVPDGFYRGDATQEPQVGQRGAWYAWEWGDALFVVLDPFWYSMTQSSRDPWAQTLGEKQYLWLQGQLAGSQAAYKFVFIHNLVGGLDGQMRGGVEAAPYFEWGGRNADGSSGFAQKRPGWSQPIHDLLVRYGVTAVFHGHDHLYAKQVLDGIVYQEVPQPSARNSTSGASLAKDYHYASGTILSSSGHLRVTVSPEGVTAHYVRAWLPANETAQRRNAQIDDTWTLPRR